MLVYVTTECTLDSRFIVCIYGVTLLGEAFYPVFFSHLQNLSQGTMRLGNNEKTARKQQALKVGHCVFFFELLDPSTCR